MTITPFGQGASPGRDQERPLADRLVQVLEAVLDHAPEPPAVKSEALAAAALHVFGMSRHGGNWDEDGRALAQLVQATGYIAGKNIGGPCAIPPGVILGNRPASLQAAGQAERRLRVVTDDRPADAEAPAVNLPDDCPVQALGMDGGAYVFQDANGDVVRLAHDRMVFIPALAALFGDHLVYAQRQWPGNAAAKHQPVADWPRVRRALQEACAAKGVWPDSTDAPAALQSARPYQPYDERNGWGG